MLATKWGADLGSERHFLLDTSDKLKVVAIPVTREFWVEKLRNGAADWCPPSFLYDYEREPVREAWEREEYRESRAA